MSNDNMTLWESVRTPDPAHTKGFSRGGGFKGTATNAVYLIQRATELWGPMGGDWGVEIVDERIHEGAPLLANGVVVGHEKVHTIRINLRHPGGVVPGFGQTMLVGTNKYGPYTDEEAPKKSLTDALTKALSWLGFAADIHLGRWDDNKYVNAARQAHASERAAPAAPAAANEPAPQEGMPADVLADWLAAVGAATAEELDDLTAQGLASAQAALDRDAWRAIRTAGQRRQQQLKEAA